MKGPRFAPRAVDGAVPALEVIAQRKKLTFWYIKLSLDEKIKIVHFLIIVICF
jgi:hypothetical protein